MTLPSTGKPQVVTVTTARLSHTDDVALRERSVEAARKRLHAGASPESAVLAAQAALARAELDVARASQRADSARQHLRGLPRPHDAVGGNQLDLQCVCHQRLFWISSHFLSTSSRPPHMKKACSATWS